MFTVAGFQVPVIPLEDVPGNVGTVPDAQMVDDVPKLNTGKMFGLTVTVKEVDRAHCPTVGVKLYVPEFWVLTVEGLQVPVIPFPDVVGNAGTVPPAQMVNVVPKLNVGTMLGFTVTVNVAGKAQTPAVGVNV